MDFMRLARLRPTAAALGLAIILAVITGTLIAFERPDDQEPPARQVGMDLFGDPLPHGAVARLGTTRLRHGGLSPALVFANEGKVLISSNEDNTLRVWDLTTRKQIRGFELGKEGSTRIQAIALSPDGKLLASGGYDGIGLWDAQTGKELRQLGGGSVRSLAFTADGQTLLSGGSEHDSAVRIFDVATGKERSRLLWHKREVRRLASTPDGRMLVSASPSEGKIICVNFATGQELRTIQNREVNIDAIALSPDALTAAAGGMRWPGGAQKGEPWLCLYDLNTGNELGRLQGHEHYVQALAFSADGRTLASGSYDKTIRFWDVATGKETAKITRPTDRVRGFFAFSPDGKTLATLGGDSTIHLWDVATGKEIHEYPGHVGVVNTIAFSPDGKLIATGSYEDNSVQIWEAVSGKRLRMIQHPAYVRSVAFLPDGSLLSGGGDSLLRVWNVANGQELRTFTVEGRQQVLSMRLSHDGKVLLAFTTSFGEPQDAAVTTGWDVPTGKQLFQHKTPRGFGSEIPAASPDARRVAVESGPGIVIREAATNKELLTIKPPEGYRVSDPMSFSPNGKLLAAWSSRPRQDGPKFFHDNYGVRVYDTGTGNELHHFPIGAAWALSAFSPDGKRLAVAGERSLLILDLASGKELRRIEGLDARVQALAFSPDGKRLASGLSNTTVLIWDAAEASSQRP